MGVISLRDWGYNWYSTLLLPDLLESHYVVAINIIKVRSRTKDYTISIPFFGITIVVNHLFIYLYFLELKDNYVVIDTSPLKVQSLVPVTNLPNLAWLDSYYFDKYLHVLIVFTYIYLVDIIRIKRLVLLWLFCCCGFYCVLLLWVVVITCVLLCCLVSYSAYA